MSNLILSIYARVSNALAREEGQDLTEYALWTGVIALTLTGIGVLAALTGAVDLLGAGIGDCIDFKSSTACAPF